MTTKRAIKILKAERLGDGEEMKCAKYIAAEVLEKAIFKKPIINKENINNVNYKIYMCPCCKKQIIKKIDGDIFVGRMPYYCDNCGQALNWSEMNG